MENNPKHAYLGKIDGKLAEIPAAGARAGAARRDLPGPGMAKSGNRHVTVLRHAPADQGKGNLYRRPEPGHGA
ncbi:hypothetical protein [Microbispora sp. NPDC046933]|uniref:hypothetical protein n=1 Tax=Microbispora sp. NPDC046933 TaxID=3155618 RepID=UPI0033DDD9B5